MKIRVNTFAMLLIICLNADRINSQTVSGKWKFGDKPVWSDEFDSGKTPDTTKWRAQTGGGGWGNNEVQFYTKSGNALIENGMLKIIARKEKMHGKNFTSSRIITKNKADWKYGRFEMRLKLPKGRGTWPAVWLLPNDYSENNESSYCEIDLLEHVGYDPQNVYFSVHFKDNSDDGDRATDSAKVKTAESEFHTYRMDWTPHGIRGFVDDKKYFELLSKKDKRYKKLMGRKFFLIVNLAVGGDWGGHKGIDKNIFPAVMEVDYVRVYPYSGN